MSVHVVFEFDLMFFSWRVIRRRNPIRRADIYTFIYVLPICSFGLCCFTVCISLLKPA